MPRKKKPGRPAGSQNVTRDQAEAKPSRCKACDSTEREAYTKTDVQEFGGQDPNGRPFTHIVRRWTRCAACGQARIDLSYENRRAE